MHTKTLRGLAVLLAFVVAASSVRAGPETQTTDAKLSQVLEELKDVTRKLGAIQIRQDVQITAMQSDLNQLKADVSRLNDELRRLSPVKTTIAASINPDAAPPAVGTLVLTNQYSYPATFYVNGRPIRVQPAQQARVSEPSGRFSFEVYTDDHADNPVHPLSERVLVAGRTYPITVNP